MSLLAQHGLMMRVHAPPPVEVDPYWVNVLSLLNFNGADGSTSFADETGRAWSAAGGAQIDTEQSVFGGSSGLFNGSSSRIETPGHADFNVVSGDFTVEAFVRTTDTSSHRAIVNNVDTLNNGGWKVFTTTGGVVGVQAFKSGASGGVLVVNALSASGVVLANEWSHVAVTKQGALWRLFWGGVLVASQTQSEASAQSLNPLTIGRDAANLARFWNGWVDEFRLTKGIARYISNFVPPSAPFPTAGP